MKRKGKRLSDAFVEKVERVGCYGDGRGGSGLQLRVHAATSGHTTKSWRQFIRIGGKPTGLGIGRYPDLSLDEARVRALQNRVSIARGIDPRSRTRTPRNTVAPVAAPIAKPVPTFAEAGEAVLSLKSPGWKTGTTTEARWRRDIAALPFLRKPVNAIDQGDVMACLEPIWTSKNPTAKHRLGVIRAAMAWSIASGHRSDDPTSAIKAILKPAANGHKHHRALHHSEVAGALARIRSQCRKPRARRENGLLLEFVALTGVRGAEAAGARWGEIDGDTWTVPASRMKAARKHAIPISAGARAVLAEARDLNPESELCFPAKNGRAIARSSYASTFTKAGVDATIHGLRSSIRTFAAEHVSAPHEVCEAILAHRVGNAASLAYQRGRNHFAARAEIMEAWSEYLFRNSSS